MATARGTPTEMALLGLLAEAPRTGYDIKIEVETRLGHFWRESFGHIYPMLQRLKRRRWVTVRPATRTSGHPARKLYAIAPAGRAALVAWLKQPPTLPRPRNELLLRLFFGRHAPPGALVRDIDGYRESLAQALDALRPVAARLAAADGTQQDTLYWRLTVDYGVRVYEALLGWSEAARAALEAAGQPARD